MPQKFRLRVAIAAALIAATGLAAVSASSLASTARSHAALQIKTGLWEFSDSAKVAGDTVFPDVLLAKVPPAQRAQRLAELRQMVSQSTRERECITQASFEQRLFFAGTGCRQTITSNAAARVEVVTECRDESGAFSQHTTRKVASSSTVATMSMHAVSAQGGKTMTVDTVESGHWVSSNCGNVHGIQQL